MAECLRLLANSEHAASDCADFVLAQVAFWLLAATDGHGKNFSLQHRVDGAYGMTPLYDVLSAWPIIGHGKNQLPLEKVKLAMALHGKRSHYRVNEMQAHHWRALAEQAAVPDLWERMKSFVESASATFDRLEGTLPPGFPERVFATIRTGLRSQARRFAQTLATK